MVEVMKIMATFLQKVPRTHCYTQPLNPAAGHCHMPLLETPGHSWASLGQSLVGLLLLSPGSWCTQSFVCALQESISPVLCKFWQLYSGVNGNLLQGGLCHTQVCCIQSPCPCGCPLLTILSDYLAILLTISAYHPAGLLCPWTLGIPSQSLQ